MCTNFSTTHLHQLDIDCEFYKFKIPIQTFENTNFSSSLKIPLITNKVYNHYTLLKSLKFSSPNEYQNKLSPEDKKSHSSKPSYLKVDIARKTSIGENKILDYCHLLA